MKAAYDAGVNFFDCAEGYAAGESEKVMGECIKKYGWKRNDIVVSTKINWGGAFGDNPVNNGGLSRKHLVEGLNASLERLQLDYGEINPRSLRRTSVLMRQSTWSTPTVRTGTLPSRRPFERSTTSSTRERPSTGARRNGTAKKSPWLGESQIA
jgi:hypothetical protein